MGSSKYAKLNDPVWLRRRYVKGSMAEIGRELGCAGATVGKALRRHGIIVDPPAREGPVDLRPVFSRQTPTPAGGCKCERPIRDEEERCVRCGR